MLGRDSELRRVWWAVTGKDKALGDRGPEIAAAMAGPGDMVRADLRRGGGGERERVGEGRELLCETPGDTGWLSGERQEEREGVRERREGGLGEREREKERNLNMRDILIV